MSVRKYHNKFRAAVFFNRMEIQTYFDKESEAQEYIDTIHAIKRLGNKDAPWSTRLTKRKNANHQDLPIGWTDYIQSRVLKSGNVSETPILSCAFKHNKKTVFVRCAYGRIRTRGEAIVMLTKKILLKMEELEKSKLDTCAESGT